MRNLFLMMANRLFDAFSPAARRSLVVALAFFAFGVAEAAMSVIPLSNNAEWGTVDPATNAVVSAGSWSLTAKAKKGYSFNYWYMVRFNSDGTQKISTSTVNPISLKYESSVIFYQVQAIFSPNAYNVRLDPGDGATVATNNLTTSTGLSLQGLVDPVWTDGGCTFAGSWRDDFGNTYTNGAPTAAYDGSEFTLHANWKTNSYAVTTSVEPLGGGVVVASPASGPYPYRSKVSLLAVAASGFEFTQWSDGASANPRTVTVGSADAAFVANFAGKTHYVDFDANGDGAAVVGSSSKKVTYGGTYGALPGAEWVGRTLLGWFTEPVRGSEITPTTTVSLTGDETLYAQWHTNRYVVKFDLNGGSGTLPGDQQFVYDVPSELSRVGTAPVREHFVFDGWAKSAAGEKEFDDGESVVNLTCVDGGEVTLYAHWRSTQYFIEFDPNGADGGEMAAASCDRDVGFELPSNRFYRAGYDFGGWATNASQAAHVYGDGATVTNLAEAGATASLLAVWNARRYDIVFEPCGGYYKNDGSELVVTQSVFYGEVATLGECAYGHNAGVFLGWATNASGAVVYEDCAAVSNMTTSSSVSLYAVWDVRPGDLSAAVGCDNLRLVSTNSYGRQTVIVVTAWTNDESVCGGVRSGTCNAEPDYRLDSTLSVQIHGSGRLVFSWGIDAKPPAADRVFCSVTEADGTETSRLTPPTNDFATVTLDFDGVGPRTVRWVRSSYFATEYNLRVKSVRWYPHEAGKTLVGYTDSQGNAVCVAVPDEWTNEHFTQAEIESAGGMEQLLKTMSGKRGAGGVSFAYFNDYIFGTDPKNESDEFVATIEMNGSTPVVEFKPNLGAERVYATEGVGSLGDKWHSPPSASDRFFRVTVSLP